MPNLPIGISDFKKLITYQTPNGEGLEISKYPECLKKQGTQPVIFITLKNIKAQNFEQAIVAMKEQISLLFDDHISLLKSEKLTSVEKNLKSRFNGNFAYIKRKPFF